MSERLIKQMREQRMSWVALDDAHKIRIIRPTEVEIGAHLIKDGRVQIDHLTVVRFCTDWAGFTEADILGAGVGGSDAVPYSAALWTEVASDRVDWVSLVGNAILSAAAAHQEAKDAASKN